MSLRKIVFPKDLGLNVKESDIIEQVGLNIKRHLPQAQPHAPNSNTVALVCGGPSLITMEKELAKASWDGAKVVCVNGTYRWCIERNIRPSAVVLLDAREFNARFVEPDVKGCRYLLASQCHPEAFELTLDRDVTIWHACSAGQPELDLLNDYYFGRCFPVTIGTTVAIRAVSLLRMLGFQNFDIFGLDSCWMDNKHHAYDQRENDRDQCIPVWLTPEGRADLRKQFFCAPWMMKQAEDFQQLIRERGNDFRLNVRGDGLIASIMRFAAELGSEICLDTLKEVKHGG